VGCLWESTFKKVQKKPYATAVRGVRKNVKLPCRHTGQRRRSRRRCSREGHLLEQGNSVRRKER